MRRRGGCPWPLRAALLLPLVLLAGCGGEETPGSADGPGDGEDRTAAVLEARTRGQNLLQQDRLDEAAEQFRRLAELAPERSAGPANLALVALRRGDGAAAGQRAREALERAPDDPWIHLILARALELQGRPDEARAERRRALELDPGNRRALWTLAGGSSERGEEPAEPGRRAEMLARLVEEDPSSLPARMELAATRLALGDAEAAAVQLEEVRSIAPELSPASAGALDRALERARRGDADGAREPFRRLQEEMRMLSAYRADLEELRGPRGEATGFPVLSFSHEISLRVPDEEEVLESIRFVDATASAGLEGAASVVAAGDLEGDGDRDLYVVRGGGEGDGAGRLLRNDLGRFEDVTPRQLGRVTGVRDATFADYDADGLQDLYLVRRGPNRLFHNEGDGRFREVSGDAGVADDGTGGTAAWMDLDHDGDLDLLVADGEGARLYRNRGDGTFGRVEGAMGLARATAGTREIGFADMDDDADLDLVMARGEEGVSLFANLRQDRFAAVTDSAGLADAGPAAGVAVGDLDNDGHTDLLFPRPGTSPALFRNRGDGTFARVPGAESGLDAGGAARAAFLDFDNDGHLDVALAGEGGVSLFRNRGGEGGEVGFADRSDLLPSDLPASRELEVFDYNDDGDLDLLLSTDRGLRLLRNDGGNVNHHFDLQLVARGPGSGKVNRFGIGSTVEVRAGDLYQRRTVREPVTHFGLGHRLKADVVRIVWTNGVPQYLHYPGTDEDLLQDQQLKGSCAFVYAWDGDGYEFVTDAVWRSALGMPLGIMGGPGAGGDASGGAAGDEGDVPGKAAGRDRGVAGPAGGAGTPTTRAGAATASNRRYAPAASSREYVRIPGDRLVPRDGRYRLQITEELWEVAYIDEVKLLAVDHPDSMEVFVDEKFVPPAPPELRLYRVGERLPPAAARNGEGEDLLPRLRSRDHRYVSDLRAGPYQGIVEPHAMVLELPPEAARAPDPHLFLRGWIFPTDASINLAVAQNDSVTVRPPTLEVPDGRGGWRTAVPDVGFPAGKAKTVVVDLSEVVRPGDPRIRIRTNMQVYWDQAFFAAGGVEGPAAPGGADAAVARLEDGAGPATGAGTSPRVRVLDPAAADLHFRGFSREYRKGGRHGPHWFDYDSVSTDPRWLPIRGRYTRFGDVRPLLGERDDRYVVMAPGDEMTVEFDAGDAPALPEGWTRTFLLYTDGWIKDADMNTATGNTVAPLPFHGQSRYPPPPGEAFPRDSAHRAWMEEYQTRRHPGSILRLAPGGDGR